MIPKQFKVIVYVTSFKNLRDLKRYGLVVFSSKKFHYVVMYVDHDNYEKIEDSFHQLSSVTKIELSPLNSLVTTFSQTQDLKDDDDDEI